MNLETGDLRGAADRQSLKGSTLDTRQAAAYLGVSKPYLDKLRCYGGGPRFAKLGRRVVYRIPDLDLWLEQHLKANTSETARPSTLATAQIWTSRSPV